MERTPLIFLARMFNVFAFMLVFILFLNSFENEGIDQTRLQKITIVILSLKITSWVLYNKAEDEEH